MLDFKIKSQTDRKDFIKKELSDNTSPSNSQLELYANYILWGMTDKGEKDKIAKNIKTKIDSWQKSKETSLDEFSFLQSHVPKTVAYIRKEKFSREAALEDSPQHLKETLINLFKLIDETDLIITYYELIHNKRTKEPRTDLLNSFTQKEKEQLFKIAEKLDEHTYLKKRHLLIDLRTEQYTIRDSYSPTILQHPVKHISQDGQTTSLTLDRIDLKNPTHLAGIVDQLDNLYELKLRRQEFNTHDNNESFLDDGAHLIEEIINKFYSLIEKTNLEDYQLDILQKRIQHIPNDDIRWEINKKYGKTYSVNYISTIYHQKILPKIAKTADLEFKLATLDKKDLKKCRKCQRVFPREAEYFRRQARAKDGFMPICKECAKGGK